MSVGSSGWPHNQSMPGLRPAKTLVLWSRYEPGAARPTSDQQTRRLKRGMVSVITLKEILALHYHHSTIQHHPIAMRPCGRPFHRLLFSSTHRGSNPKSISFCRRRFHQHPFVLNAQALPRLPASSTMGSIATEYVAGADVLGTVEHVSYTTISSSAPGSSVRRPAAGSIPVRNLLDVCRPGSRIVPDRGK